MDATRLLDSDVASTRIAGVMVLAEIADTYRGNYRQSVVDILCGYLRTWHREEEKGHDAAVESAILSVIATHVNKVIRNFIPDLFNYDDITQLHNRLSSMAPRLAEDLSAALNYSQLLKMLMLKSDLIN